MAKQKMKTVDMSVNPEELDSQSVSISADQQVSELGESEEAAAAEVKVKKAHSRSKKYQAARSQVDRTRTYSLTQAVELVQKTYYAKFAGTVSADLVVRDEKTAAEVTFPYSTGRVVRVAIVNDDVMAKIEAGTLDFDVLVTHPSFMPKLAKFARLLGPKGLMPNPKNGTVSTDPEKRAAELAGGKTSVKTEKKAPLIHVVIGKVDQPAAELTANAETLLKALGTGKVVKMTLAASMSPGVKVELPKA